VVAVLEVGEDEHRARTRVEEIERRLASHITTN
jgi:hypothetical protein